MSPRKPNLLFIFTDEQRKFDLGCYGNPEVMTPHIDSLAREGARFEHCMSNSPVCVPARGSLLTGLYAQRHGAYTNDLEIRYDVESIADVLNAGGYHTGYVGKWHLCGVPRNQFIDRPRRMGFMEWKVANCNHNYLKCYYDDEENRRTHEEGYEPEIFGELACEFLERNATEDQPFALFVSFASPHGPHNLVGEAYKKLYADTTPTLRPNVSDSIMINLQTHATPQNAMNWLRGYYAHITAIDSQVGRMLEILERRGVMDNTLVVFTADHGSMLGSQGLVDKQVPFEESVGVPLIMRMKDKIPAGTREGMIGLVDLPVTVAGLLNLRFTEQTDGADLGAMVTAETPTGLDNCYLYDLYPCHQAFDKGMQAWRGIRTERYTYAVRGTGEDWLLFDNLTDPYQLHNLVDSHDHREIREELRESLTRHVHAHDGFMNGNDYIRFTHREEEFDRSQTFFGRPILSQL